VGGSCGHGNEPSASVNCMGFVDSLKNYSISLPRWTLLKGVSLKIKLMKRYGMNIATLQFSLYFHILLLPSVSIY
jgi:hypothetical protein